MRISDWSSDVCSSDLAGRFALRRCLLVEERTQVVRAARMAQLAQRLGLDLANALAGDVELLADFFERVVGVHVDAEAHPQHLGLTRRSEEHTSELQSLMRISYAVFCLKKKKKYNNIKIYIPSTLHT